MAVTFYMAEGDKQIGPFSLYELRAHGLRPDTLVWREGMADWKRADSVTELRALLYGPVVEREPSAHVMDTAPAQANPYPAAPAYAATPTYPGPGAGGSIPYQGAHDMPRPASGLAITSMVLGIIALPLFCFWYLSIPLAILAVIFGHIAHGQARRGEIGGGGMAVAGLICGYCALGLILIFVLIFAGIFAASL